MQAGELVTIRESRGEALRDAFGAADRQLAGHAWRGRGGIDRRADGAAAGGGDG